MPIVIVDTKRYEGQRVSHIMVTTYFSNQKSLPGPTTREHRDGKDQGEDSPKQAGSCWFARSCWLLVATSGANLYPPSVWFADRCHISGVTLFCFASFSYLCFHWSRGPLFIRYSMYRRPDSHTCFFSFFPFCLFGGVAFFRVLYFLYHYCRFLFVWRVCRTFLSLPGGVFLPCDHGLDFDIKQSIMPTNNRLFYRGWVRSAMASRKSINIYIPKIFYGGQKMH